MAEQLTPYIVIQIAYGFIEPFLSIEWITILGSGILIKIAQNKLTGR
jgi:hypothetical protein